MNTTSTVYQIALANVKGLGLVTAKRLLDHYGSSERILTERIGELNRLIGGRGGVTVQGIKEALQSAEREVQFMEKNNIVAYHYLDDAYPKRLKEIVDCPLMFYFKGSCNLNHKKILSVVGTRRATSYGLSICREWIGELASLDVLIVSGMALGIDIEAHRSALKHGCPTLGIFAHGLDRVYPSSHAAVARQMLENGGLGTEHITGTNPDRENFPKRNRIIAGLADATLVVEAAEVGGALITGRLARGYDREVFAIPGRLGDQYSKGTNGIIRNHIAQIVNSPDELIEEMGWNVSGSTQQKLSFFDKTLLNPVQKEIYHILENKGGIHIDVLLEVSGVERSQLIAVLLEMEMLDAINSLPGNRYTLK